MRLSERRLTSRELALVAAALLLPVPLVALGGYAAALPGAVERGLGSLVTLEAHDERSGVDVSGQASQEGDEDGQAADGTLSIGRSTGSPQDEQATPAGSGGDDAAPDSSDRDGDETPAADDPHEDGDTGSAEAPSEEGGSAGGTSGSPPPSDDSPSAVVTVGAQGIEAGVSADGNGVTIDVGTDTGNAGSDEAGSVGVDVTDTEGSSTSLSVGIPGTGSIP